MYVYKEFALSFCTVSRKSAKSDAEILNKWNAGLFFEPRLRKTGVPAICWCVGDALPKNVSVQTSIHIRLKTYNVLREMG